MTGVEIWPLLGCVAWIAAAWFNCRAQHFMAESIKSHREAVDYYEKSGKLIRAAGEAMALHGYGAHREARQVIAEAVKDLEKAGEA